MKNAKVLLVILPMIIGVSLSCKFIKDKASKTVSERPVTDFTSPSAGVDVKVELDKKHTSSGEIGSEGGSVSLTSADGSKFTLEVPANALDAKTTITMTAVKTLDGAPLDTNTPTAVQLEPSGLHFNEFLTLTIVPAKEMPIKNQVMFGYEGDGKDYHLMPIDPKSKEIKIKMINFSAGGVGSASDVAWAANLAIQARDAAARMQHKMGEYMRSDRMEVLLGESEGDPDWHAKLIKAYDDWEDQVVRKEMAAAELDCKHARKALHRLVDLGRGRRLIGVDEGRIVTENMAKFNEMAAKCRRSFRVAASSNSVSFTGEICSLDRMFSIDGKYPGGSAKTTFEPGNAADDDKSGTTIVTGGGGACTHTGGGEFTVTHNEDGSSTLKWTTTDSIACPGFSNTRTATFTLPLQPAEDLTCP